MADSGTVALANLSVLTHSKRSCNLKDVEIQVGKSHGNVLFVGTAVRVSNPDSL